MYLQGGVTAMVLVGSGESLPMIMDIIDVREIEELLGRETRHSIC